MNISDPTRVPTGASCTIEVFQSKPLDMTSEITTATPVDVKPDLLDPHAISTLPQTDHPYKEGDATIKGDGLVKSRFDTLGVWQTLWVFRKAAFYCFIAFTSSIMDSFEVSMAGSIIANEGFIRQFGRINDDGKYELNTAYVSAWGAIINVGQILAVTHVRWIADRFGRVKALMVGWLYMLIALLLMTFARSPPVWLVAKLFIGMGVGTAQITTTPYEIEISPVKCRGTLQTLGMIWGSVGGVLCSVMLQVCNAKYPLNYLLPVYVEYAFVGLLAVCYVVLPESPWFFARTGNKERCMKSLRRLYGGIEGYDFEEEWGIIMRTIQHEQLLLSQTKAQPWAECFTGMNLRRTSILILLAAAGQFGGNALIGTYSTYFFQYAGMTDPFQASMIQSCIGFASVIFYTAIIDKWGRRRPVCISYTTMVLMLWLMGALWYAHTTIAPNILLGLVCVYQLAQTIFGNSYFLLGSEIASAQLRMKTQEIVWYCQALLGIAFCFATPPLLAKGNLRAGFFYAGMSTPIVAYLWYALPETRGRAVAEIDELYERRIPAWRWAQTTTNAEAQLESAMQMVNVERV